LVRFGKIWANLIGFGQNQNLVAPKTFDFLRLWSKWGSRNKILGSRNIATTRS